MKAAFAIWDSKISPVFDVTRQIHVVDAEAGKILGETQASLSGEMPTQKALRLAELGVQTLVCGAISRHTQVMVEVRGIRVIPFVTGELHEVINAWLSATLENELFAIPGCYGRKHRNGFPGFCRGEQEEYLMKGRNRNGYGPRGGQGGGGQGRSRKSDPLAGAAIGTCVCPKCGQREPHERGVPCVQKKCPGCGTAMTRE